MGELEKFIAANLGRPMTMFHGSGVKPDPKWEMFGIRVVSHPYAPPDKAYLIVDEWQAQEIEKWRPRLPVESRSEHE